MIGCGCELFKQITVIHQDTCFSMLRRAVSLINYDPNQITCNSCFICATISKDLQSHTMMDTILMTWLPPALSLDFKQQSRGIILRILELINEIESNTSLGIIAVFIRDLFFCTRLILIACKSNALLLMRFFSCCGALPERCFCKRHNLLLHWVGSSSSAPEKKNNNPKARCRLLLLLTFRRVCCLKNDWPFVNFQHYRLVPSCPTSNLPAGSVQILISHGNCSVASTTSYLLHR